MPIVWLGFLFLSFFSFQQSKEKFGLCFVEIQKSLVPKQEVGILSFAFRMFLLAVLSGSPLQARMTSLAMVRRGLWSFRWGLVFLCLSNAAMLIWLVLFALAFQILGGFLLIGGGLAALAQRRIPALAQFLWFIFFSGLFLTALENTVRMGGFLSALESYQDFVFFMSDNRPSAVLISFLASAAVTLMLRSEAWSWIVSLVGLSLGILSLNNAVALIVGESLGWGLVIWATTRRASPGFSFLGKEMALISLVVSAFFLVCFGYLRSELSISGLGRGQLTERLEVFFFSAAAWLFVSTFLFLIWGHFRSRQVWSKELPAEVPTFWFEQKWIIPTFVQRLSPLPPSR